MSNFHIRKAVPDDAERMAHCLVAGNRVAFSGLVPHKCLDFPVTESGRNRRKTLVENKSSQEFLLHVAENAAGMI